MITGKLWSIMRRLEPGYSQILDPDILVMEAKKNLSSPFDITRQSHINEVVNHINNDYPNYKIRKCLIMGHYILSRIK